MMLRSSMPRFATLAALLLSACGGAQAIQPLTLHTLKICL